MAFGILFRSTGLPGPSWQCSGSRHEFRGDLRSSSRSLQRAVAGHRTTSRLDRDREGLSMLPQASADAVHMRWRHCWILRRHWKSDKTMKTKRHTAATCRINRGSRMRTLHSCANSFTRRFGPKFVLNPLQKTYYELTAKFALIRSRCPIAELRAFPWLRCSPIPGTSDKCTLQCTPGHAAICVPHPGRLGDLTLW